MNARIRHADTVVHGRKCGGVEWRTHSKTNWFLYVHPHTSASANTKTKTNTDTKTNNNTKHKTHAPSTAIKVGSQP